MKRIILVLVMIGVCSMGLLAGATNIMDSNYEYLPRDARRNVMRHYPSPMGIPAMVIGSESGILATSATANLLVIEVNTEFMSHTCTITLDTNVSVAWAKQTIDDSECFGLKTYALEDLLGNQYLGLAVFGNTGNLRVLPTANGAETACGLSTAISYVIPPRVWSITIVRDSSGNSVPLTGQIQGESTILWTTITQDTRQASVYEMANDAVAETVEAVMTRSGLYLFNPASSVFGRARATGTWHLQVSTEETNDSMASVIYQGDTRVSSTNQLYVRIESGNDSIFLSNTDVFITNTDVFLTNTDVFQINTDVFVTNTNTFQTNTDVFQINTDVFVTNTGTFQTNTDVFVTNTDVLQINTDVFITNTDVLLADTKVWFDTGTSYSLQVAWDPVNGVFRLVICDVDGRPIANTSVLMSYAQPVHVQFLDDTGRYIVDVDGDSLAIDGYGRIYLADTGVQVTLLNPPTDITIDNTSGNPIPCTSPIVAALIQEVRDFLAGVLDVSLQETVVTLGETHVEASQPTGEVYTGADSWSEGKVISQAQQVKKDTANETITLVGVYRKIIVWTYDAVPGDTCGLCVYNPAQTVAESYGEIIGNMSISYEFEPPVINPQIKLRNIGVQIIGIVGTQVE